MTADEREFNEVLKDLKDHTISSVVYASACYGRVIMEATVPVDEFSPSKVTFVSVDKNGRRMEWSTHVHALNHLILYRP